MNFPELLTPEQMNAADLLAVQSGQSEMALIREAAAHVADYIVSRFQHGPILALCGPGKNGADGVMAAQILKARGWPIRIALSVPVEDTKGPLRFLLDEYRGDIESFAHLPVAKDCIVIDAVYGAGFRMPLPQETGFLFDRVRMAACAVVAIDMPSGIDGATGEADQKTLQALATICFFRRKPAHLLYPARTLSGEIIVRPLSIPESVFNSVQPTIFENTPLLWEQRLPHKNLHGHKYDSGHLVVLGDERLTGAATLAALAGLRQGAGLVSIVSPKKSIAVYQSQSPSLMVEKLSSLSRFSQKHFSDSKRHALVVGPGAVSFHQASLRLAVLGALQTKKPIVIDAAAIKAFAGHKALLVGLGHGRCVFTPHDGEFISLFPNMKGARINLAREAAEFLQSVVVLKGPDTVIAAPGGWCVINPNGCPYLATAGTGDVLSGMIGGFMAQGMDGFEASCAAVYKHAHKAWAIGAGLISSDLVSLN